MCWFLSPGLVTLRFSLDAVALLPFYWVFTVFFFIFKENQTRWVFLWLYAISQLFQTLFLLLQGSDWIFLVISRKKNRNPFLFGCYWVLPSLIRLRNYITGFFLLGFSTIVPDFASFSKFGQGFDFQGNHHRNPFLFAFYWLLPSFYITRF